MKNSFASHKASVLTTIGNTPLVQLHKVAPPECADIFVKLEYFNPTGSYKDRMALAMIEEAEERGELRPGMTVVEYTGGSTGSALAFICAAKGYRFKVVSSDAYAKEKLDTMQAFGADLTIVPSDEGKISSDLVSQMVDKAKEFAASDNTYFTDQFNNRDSLEGYKNIGLELLEQIDRKIDAFCGGVGTAGMLMGVAQIIRNRYSTRVIALEPASSAVISTGKTGAHHIEGVGVGFVPPLFDRDLCDDVWGIEETEARDMARKLARDEGIFAGTSTGLNVAGAIRLSRELGPGHVVATVACDTGLKYITGNLFDNQ
jgi:cysteine synthase